MEVYSGAIVSKDYSFAFDSIWGTQNTGWGNGGGTMSVGAREKAAPYQLEFTWYSLVEKKFYTGKWALDKERIEHLFDQGFIDQDTHKKDTYSVFKVGLAPKGRVVLWLSGPGNQKEVGAFSAQSVIIKPEDAYSNAQYMFKDGYAERMLNDPAYKTFTPAIREKIRAQVYPAAEVYDTYREKYVWKPVVVLPDGGHWMDFGMHTFNGEQESLFGDSLLNNQYEKRAIPKFSAFYWQDAAANRYGVWIDAYDEQEMFEIFQKLGQETNIDLIMKVNSDNTRLSLALKSADQQLPITKATIRLSRKIE